ncbi:MAG: GntR family transcriptional regulator [Victivallaceae bacterium]|nr:GntR family transcriptional regulator [Victivallaceae bacterium]
MRKLSKVDTLKLKIIEDIGLGILKPGDKVYSRHQFMRRFKCSRGSIDKAVAALVREGFLLSRQGAGTFVAAGKSVASETERVYLIGDFGRINAYSQIFQAGSLAAELQKRTNCFLCANKDVSLYLENISRAGTAVIWDHPRYDQMMVMNYLRRTGIRQVLVHRIFGDYEYITIDYEAGISEGLDWLLEQGRELAYFTTATDTSFPYIAERQLCFFELAIRKNMKIPSNWFFNAVDRHEDSLEKVEEQALKLFRSNKRPKLIYADCCTHAVPIMAVAQACGLKAGKDFRLLIFDYENFLAKIPGTAMILQNMESFNDNLVEWALKPACVMKRRIKPELVFGK